MRALVLSVVLLALAGCNHLLPVDLLELCPPTDSRVGFLSAGDCVFTRDDVFKGHEWLTFFANADIEDPRDRFVPEEINAIIQGNRRVDFPLELLVHLNHSPVAYIHALTAYHDQRENQPVHFLLDDTNDSPEAVAHAHASIAARTREAVALWATDRTRALTLIGQVCHTIQDAFSPAHTRRAPDHPEVPWCVQKVKAYMPRAPGFDTPEIEFHGTSGGTERVGHATPEDSITRINEADVDEACRAPTTAPAVRDCLTDEAQRAVIGTRDYLRQVHHWVRAGVVDPAELDAYLAEHLSLCPDGPD